MARDFKENIIAGLVTSLISYPLVIALAASVGTTPSVGTVSAFWSCLIAVLLGGCRFTIFGPTSILASLLVVLVRFLVLPTPY